MTHRWGRGGALPQFNPVYYGSRMLQPMTVPEYLISRSLRFNSADTAYLNRTPGVAGTRTKFTISFWCKRAKLGTFQRIFTTNAANNDNDTFEICFSSSDTFVVSGWTVQFLNSTRVFRDPSAWYHIVVAVDTTQGTANNRIRVYVNGVEETAFGTRNNPSSSANMGWCGAHVHRIGIPVYASSEYWDGYLADVHSIDGQQLTPSDFGETNATTGQWVPKKYTGSFGTTGFWLSFYDNTSTTTLGRDDAGGAAGSAAGSNDWTLNNFSVTAGVGNDSLTDTPTNNYCVLCPVAKDADVTLLNGGLDFSCTSGGLGGAIGTFAPSSGKWYWEVTPTSGASATAIGIAKLPLSAYDASQTGTYLYLSGGNKRLSPSTDSAYGASFTDNDVIGVALDMDAGTVTFYKNNSSQGTAFSSLSGDFSAWVQDGSGGVATTAVVNFGQRAFSYTPPTGFVALCTSNLADPAIVKPSAQFDVETFTGTGATRSKTGLAFQPDLVWFKGRSGVTDHAIYDSARGVQKQLESNTTGAETTETTGLTAFNSDGYTTGSLAQLNTNAATYAAWIWKEGVTPGFDIVSYTGDGTSGRDIAHSLGVAPKMIFTKARSDATYSWHVWHTGIGSDYYLGLNTTAARDNSVNIFPAAGITSSNFRTATSATRYNNLSAVTYVAYLWAEVAGFSRFGTYTGNGNADGPFEHCGFRPRWILWKRTDTTGGWYVYDTARFTYNAMDNWLQPNAASAESTGSLALDILSNGYKIRSTNADINASAGTYVFAAFAESAFKYANAR